jgi:hypothetical protein
MVCVNIKKFKGTELSMKKLQWQTNLEVNIIKTDEIVAACGGNCGVTTHL